MHRRVLAEVPLEADCSDARIGLVELLEHCEGAVRRPVVDEDQLERTVEGVERRHGPAVELVQRRRLVEQGDDDREVWPRHLVRDRQ